MRLTKYNKVGNNRRQICKQSFFVLDRRQMAEYNSCYHRKGDEKVEKREKKKEIYKKRKSKGKRNKNSLCGSCVACHIYPGAVCLKARIQSRVLLHTYPCAFYASVAC